MSLDLDALLTTAEAAVLARVSKATIRTWARRYPTDLPKHPASLGRVRFRAGDVLEVERKTRTSR